ncbi:MFS transporter [Bombiscardovia apis]|uniref:MFS transporter n=1 Tax=Bombiscardovia apis TaxID=2932182 RepID=A0ABM8BDA6_9BIFI|nr:MFS transporter [Bombiscardovia apis]BDR54889.1 MFS transporter [Bombiscardovia apis]
MRWLREFMSLPVYLRSMLIVDLICSFGSGLVWPIELLFATHSLGASMSQATITVTCSAVGALISNPVVGWLSDKRSAWTAMYLAMTFAIIGPLIFALAQTFPVALVAAFISGLGIGQATAWTSILTQISSEENHSIVYGINQAEMNLGVGLGAAVGGLVAASGSDLLYRLSFAGRAAGFAFVVVALMFLDRHYQLRTITANRMFQARQISVSGAAAPSQGEHPTIAGAGPLPRVMLTMGMLTIAALFMNIFGYSQIDAGLVTTIISDAHIPSWSLALVDVFNTAAVVTLNVIFLPRLKNKNHIRILRSVPLFWAAAWFLVDFGLSRPQPMLALAIACFGIAVFGLGEVMLGISQPVVAAKLAGPRFSGRLFGFINMAQSLGYIFGPLFASFILDRKTVLPLLSTCAVALLICSLPWLLAIRLPSQTDTNASPVPTA